MYDFKKEVLAADARIKPFIRETPLDYAINLSHLTSCDVYFKCEHLQYTGAFKIRGAFNKLLTLTPEQKSQGVVTASSGNHGLAVAYSLSKLHIPGIIFVPEKAASNKIENIRYYGIPLELYGKDSIQTELFAIDYAKRHKMTYISAYNDMHVISGQGTIANELLNQHQQLDVIFVPVGGGGLISGLAGFLKSVHSSTKIIGCVPEHSPTMSRSIDLGRIVAIKSQSTLSDATTEGIEPSSMTFELCRKYVDEFISVSENEIAEAIKSAISMKHFLIEGAAALTIAAFLKVANRYKHNNIALILSGSNISLETLKTIIH